MSVNKEEVKAKLQAKLDFIKELRGFIDEREKQLSEALKSLESTEKKAEEEKIPPLIPPSEKQVSYALLLAHATNTPVTEAELRRMSRAEVSSLIDEMRRKKQGAR
jgi:hypothetical protein